MEKNGSLQLTLSEYHLIQKGEIPDRIKHDWGLSLEEISDIINQKLFELTGVSPALHPAVLNSDINFNSTL